MGVGLHGGLSALAMPWDCLAIVATRR
eukprot:SAG25_NODE_3924_length_927_cov_1.856280_1_plen_26_part_01